MIDTFRPADDQLPPLLVELIFVLSDDLKGVVGDILAELELTDALADALWQLDPAGPPPSMRQLAAGLRCDPSTVTFLADRLMERGLIDVRVDPADRRRKMVTLTPKGADIRQRLLATLTNRTSMTRLSPEEQRQLYNLLSRAVTAT